MNDYHWPGEEACPTCYCEPCVCRDDDAVTPSADRVACGCRETPEFGDACQLPRGHDGPHDWVADRVGPEAGARREQWRTRLMQHANQLSMQEVSNLATEIDATLKQAELAATSAIEFLLSRIQAHTCIECSLGHSERRKVGEQYEHGYHDALSEQWVFKGRCMSQVEWCRERIRELTGSDALDRLLAEAEDKSWDIGWADGVMNVVQHLEGRPEFSSGKEWDAMKAALDRLLKQREAEARKPLVEALERIRNRTGERNTEAYCEQVLEAASTSKEERNG